jgi:L-gulonolactone oxidase
MAAEWRNWAGDQRCRPAVIEHPASTAEVAAAVARAAQTGQRVRAAGAGHSFSDIALTDGRLLLLDRMDRVLDADASTGLVRVQAGITLHALSDRLAEHGLALENMGDIAVQSLAGATATATHGTGAALRNLSAAIVAVELVAAVREGQATDQDLAIDPVCRMAVDPQHAAGRLTHAGVEYHFCSLGCAGRFAAAPDAFAGRVPSG